MNLTQEQVEALRRGKPVRVASPEIGEDVLLVRASAVGQLQDELEDEREKEAWARLGMQAASAWAEENPY